MGTHATHSPLWSRGYPSWGCTIRFQVPPEPFKKKTGKLKKKNLAKNAQKNANNFFCVSGPLGNVKTYLDAKFQLIWPSNEARASRNHFFGNFRAFFEKLSFFQKSHFFSFFYYVNPQVYGYPRDPLAIVVAWVPIMGVYDQILGASRAI